MKVIKSNFLALSAAGLLGQSTISQQNCSRIKVSIRLSRLNSRCGLAIGQHDGKHEK